MRDAPRAILIASWVFVALVVALGLWVGASAALLPGCAGCHLRGPFGEQTRAAAHAKVACSACHGGATVTARLAWGASQVFGMYLRVVDTDPTLAEVPSERCRACHEDAMSGAVEAGGLRVRHDTCAQVDPCTACHGATAHGSALGWPRTASMELCIECHSATDAPVTCDLCHTGRLAADRIKTGPFAVTHGPNYRVTHGMGKMTTCAPCHTESKCATCHGAGVPHGVRFVQNHAQIAAREDAACEGCHREEFCSNCHRIEMPHPAGFTAQHIELVQRDGDALCKTCHAPEDCTRCHLMHVHPTTLEQLEGLGIVGPEGVR